MSRRGALALVVIAAAGVAGSLALASRGGDKRVVSYCRADPRPLPGDIRASIGSIKAGARKVLRREARDPSSSFARVLAGSPYTVVEEGYISSGDHGWHGRQDKVIGAIFDVRVEDPRPFDAIVPAYRYPPQGAGQNRYSSRYGYVPYKAHFSSPTGVTLLFVDVDMRTRRIVSISEESGDSGTWEPVPGHCPLPPEPTYD